MKLSLLERLTAMSSLPAEGNIMFLRIRQEMIGKLGPAAEEKVFYGLEEGSSNLFRFDPETNEVNGLGQLTVHERYGERIVASTSYTFVWHAGLEKFLFTAPMYRYPNRYQPRHLISFDPKTKIKKDHGPMKDPYNEAVPFYTEGMVIAQEGTIYLCGLVKVSDTDPGERDVLGLVVIDPETIK